MKLLISARCNLNLQTKDGNTPLSMAAVTGNVPVLKQLLHAGCNLNLAENNGATPLHIAAYQGHVAVTAHLISARCNIDQKSKDGSTPFNYSTSQGHEAISKLLIAARCNVDLQDKAGFTAQQLGTTTPIRSKKQETPLLFRRVVINGLVTKPELNGRVGTALSFDDDKGRYSVELDQTSTSFMIKPCNLVLTV